MNDETTKTSASFRAWKRQEIAVKALCAAFDGPGQPRYPDMMRAVIDEGIKSFERKAEAKAKRKAKR
jgi:hypothetical protein